MAVMRLEKNRAERRAQGERDEAGDHRRGSDGGRKLREKQARDPGDEGGRNEDGAERQRYGDQRAGHLVHRVVRGLARRQAERHVALDILDHHDGVVDDDADGQHQAEQRQVVDRGAERGEDRKGANQRDRDGDHRDDRRAPALQEQVDDADHEDDGDADRLDDFVNRLAHEGGRIIDVDVVETRRETLLELRHLVPHLVLHLDHIRARRGDDPEGGGRMAVGISDRAIVGGPHLDAADIANAGNMPLRVRLDNDVAELFGCRQSPQRFDADLVGGARVVEDRRLVEGAGRHLGVLGAQGAEDIAGADAVGSGSIWVDPDPHGVLPLAQRPEIGDTGQARDLVADVKDHIVGDVFGAAGPVRGIGMHAKEQGWDGLLDLHALQLDVLGQPGQRVLHPVMREHQGRVDIGPDFENHRDGDQTVTGRLAADVVHILDAVDRLFERRRDGAGDRLGRSAGVDGLDLDGWRNDVRVLRDRQE